MWKKLISMLTVNLLIFLPFYCLNNNRKLYPPAIFSRPPAETREINQEIEYLLFPKSIELHKMKYFNIQWWWNGKLTLLSSLKVIGLAEWSVLTGKWDIRVRCWAKLSIMETEWRGRHRGATPAPASTATRGRWGWRPSVRTVTSSYRAGSTWAYMTRHGAIFFQIRRRGIFG